MNEDIKEIDHDYTQEIVCPWCGCEYLDSGEYPDEDEIYCYECGKVFYSTRDYDITYVTTKAKYGTCIICGKKDVVLKSKHSSIMKIKDHCDKCFTIAQKQSAQDYFDYIDQQNKNAKKDGDKNE